MKLLIAIILIALLCVLPPVAARIYHEHRPGKPGKPGNPVKPGASEEAPEEEAPRHDIWYD